MKNERSYQHLDVQGFLGLKKQLVNACLVALYGINADYNTAGIPWLPDALSAPKPTPRPLPLLRSMTSRHLYPSDFQRMYPQPPEDAVFPPSAPPTEPEASAADHSPHMVAVADAPGCPIGHRKDGILFNPFDGELWGVMTAELLSFVEGLIKQGSRKRILTEYKLKFIKEAIKQHYTYQEIGQSIRISDNAVKDIINRHMNIDDKSC